MEGVFIDISCDVLACEDGLSVEPEEIVSPPIVTPAAVSTDTPNKRPRRAAAVLAEQRMYEVFAWEKCKESSSMFKTAAMQINAEFDRVACGKRKYSAEFVVDDPDSRPSSPPVPEEPVPQDPVPEDPAPVPVIEVSSDDEGAADVDCPEVDMHNDDDDDVENEDDESGSLASFVVSDSYVSEVGGVSDVETVQDESGSDVGSDCGSDSDSDSNFSCTETDSDGGTSDQCKWSDEAKS
jgi:hypothetical protein